MAKVVCISKNIDAVVRQLKKQVEKHGLPQRSSPYLLINEWTRTDEIDRSKRP